MKAIVVKYHGPTNTRGSRLVASAEGVKSLSMPFDHGDTCPEAAPAKALAIRYGWTGTYVAGKLPDGRTVWVNIGKQAGLPTDSLFAPVFTVDG